MIDQRNTSKTCHYCSQRQDTSLDKCTCFCRVGIVIDWDVNDI
ncbi:MAG: transposase [Brasilonema octagenarum HA4186-MV1]|uniref:Uncharacterized protein n=2 Tax=Brasilonema TaxID=383614 RepID=A0A856MS06_9CYAN|nr:transposase [Brasilonema octagenarum HA4186-MV1]NMF62269.1 hypothetical protein [Brasilonema octagenarum UFV-OR1]QDL12377.1 hypothetical protein DP114_22575 [Brasilonema sennae CENA114]QDL18760.1 hypothetical protein DP113_22490 [Brasilonema octagenarum UFV-E1]